MLDFPSFCRRLARELRLDGSSWQAGTAFNDEELDLDSLQMMEVTVVLEELGLDVPDEAVAQLHTVGDLYNYYVLRLAAEGEQ